MENKNRNILQFILLLIGTLVAAELCVVYYKANFMIGSGPSFCTLSSVIDCDAVARTSESRFMGIPNSLLGLGFYLFLLVLTSFNFLTSNATYNKYLGTLKNPNSYVFSLSIISVIISLILGVISEFVIHKICLLCFVTYFINFIVFFVSKGNQSMASHVKTSYIDFIETFKNPLYRSLLISATIIGFVLLAIINFFDVFNPHSSVYYASSKNLYNTSSVMLGDQHPKVVLHVYTDFQCPYCSITNSMLDRIVTEVNGVGVIHHDYPLDSACNPNVKKGLGHKNSCTYALYSIAAKKQGKFLPFKSMLFNNSENLNEKTIIANSKKLGIDYNKLKADANLQETKNSLKNDITSAISLGIDATPTMRIGMKVHKGMLPYYELKEFIINSGGIPKND